MSAPEVFPINLSPAVPIVESAYANWSGIALSAFGKAQSLVNTLSDVGFTPVNLNVPFNMNDALGPYPTVPAPDPFDMSQADPGAVGNPPAVATFNPTSLIASILPPNENFSFAPGQYADDMLGVVKATIKGMMAGDFVLPEPAATALRNRAFDAANREEARNTDQAYSDFAARGFEEPPGLLNKRLAEVRDAAQLARMSANRDVYIQDSTSAQENLRAGVSAGVQLEQALINLFTQQEMMQLEAAKFALGVAVQIFDARVRLAVSQAQITEAQAHAYSAEVSAVLGIYRAQIEQYEAKIKRIEVIKDVWLGNVELYKASAQVALGASEYDARAFQLNLERERAKIDTALKEAEQNFEQMRFFTSLLQEAKKTLATVQEGLASAAMNAVHVGSSLGYSGSESVSWGTSISGSLD